MKSLSLFAVLVLGMNTDFHELLPYNCASSFIPTVSRMIDVSVSQLYALRCSH